MTVNIHATAPAELITLRYNRGFEVRVTFGARTFRHVHKFEGRSSRGKAAELVGRINRAGGVSLAHVHASEHWTRTGAMSGCVQVNEVVVSEIETFTNGAGETAVRYQLTGIVAPHWGEQPIAGSTWDFGTRYDRTGRSHEEIKAVVESGWRPMITGCQSFELWPYQDRELEAAIAADAAKAA